MTLNILLILASGSPRRKEFIKLFGLPFSVVVPATAATSQEQHQTEIDETPFPGESPANLVQRLSRIKAEAVLNLLPSLTLPTSSDVPKQPNQQRVIIAADTVVVSNGEILGKPQTPAAAKGMLQALRQAPHQVYTGFTVALPAKSSISPTELERNQPNGDIFITQLHQSQVQMRAYTDAEIDSYVASGDPLDKAGAYGIQSKPFSPVAHLDGCFASVMGLPLAELAAVLHKLDVPLPAIGPICHKFTGHRCCQQ